jgi:hypothetical protein
MVSSAPLTNFGSTHRSTEFEVGPLINKPPADSKLKIDFRTVPLIHNAQ